MKIGLPFPSLKENQKNIIKRSFQTPKEKNILTFDQVDNIPNKDNENDMKIFDENQGFVECGNHVFAKT